MMISEGKKNKCVNRSVLIAVTYDLSKSNMLLL